MIWIVFHSLMVGLDLHVCSSLRKGPSARRFVALFGLTWAVLLALALCLTWWVGEDPYFGAKFMFLGALAQGIFVHGVLLLLLSGLILHDTSPWLGRAAWIVAGMTAWVGIDAFWIEPTRLEINRHRVESAKLSEPMRLVVLSDLQLEELGAYEKRAICAALSEEPDVLLLPGDFIHARGGPGYDRLKAQLNAFFLEVGFGGRLGTLVVGGDVDREGWGSIFDGLGANLFGNSGSVRLGGVQFSGISFLDSGNAHLKLGGGEAFHVALGHRPDFALGEVQADLLLAGHTHGGQVVLPFWGPPLTLTAVPRDWASGRTEIGAGRTLIVSRGVGMERGYAPRLRFGCPPEIVVIDLVPMPVPGP